MRDIRIGLGGDLTRDMHLAGGHQGLHGHAATRVLGQQSVENGIADGITDLVRMTLGHGLTGEKPATGRAHSFLIPQRLLVSGMGPQRTAPVATLDSQTIRKGGPIGVSDTILDGFPGRVVSWSWPTGGICGAEAGTGHIADRYRQDGADRLDTAEGGWRGVPGSSGSERP